MEKPQWGRRIAQFPAPESVGEREWGKETLLVLAPGRYTLKRIEMKAGSAGGLQYHRIKDEAGVMLEGDMVVTYDLGDGTLETKKVGPGDVFHFPAGAIHKAKALTDCVYIEASNPVFNDRVHVESFYGIDKEDGGLPSTKPWEIEFR